MCSFPINSCNILICLVFANKTHPDHLFVRLKPVEQLSPMLSPSDGETKYERKKSQPSHVRTHILTKLCAFVFKFPDQTSACCLLSSYQRQTPSITSYSRRSAKMNYSDKVSFSFSFPMKKRSKEISLIKMFVPTGYTCALQRDILYQGKMFVSDNWICFHSKVFGKDTKVLVSCFDKTH